MPGRSCLAAVCSRVLTCCWVALGFFIQSCSSHPSLSPERSSGQGSDLPTAYEVVFIIHGDGSYLFHDPDGNRFRADEEALSGAMMVAQQNTRAEVFIFHEKRRRHVLFLFPRHDGVFYHYRNGQLLAHEPYWRDQGQSRFDPELTLYNRFRTLSTSSPTLLFLYFGHEIPELAGKGYDASYHDREFTVDDLAEGLNRLRPDSTKFDLVVLSTCYNGTPGTVATLAPYARYIMASPGNLHLSYIDLRPFQSLNEDLRDGDVAAFAAKCARASFDRLAEDIQTEITVAVYDIDQVQGYVNSVDSIYDHTLASLESTSETTMEHCDCAEDSLFVRPAMSQGVDILFRSARFGRSAKKSSHSGWECPKRLVD